MKTRLLIITLLLSLLSSSYAATQSTPPPMLVASGGGYNPHAMGGFVEIMLSRAKNQALNILVVPIAFASNATTINDTDRAALLKTAEARRRQVEDSCRQILGDRLQCNAHLAPLLVRADADNETIEQYFNADLSGVFILGGDASIAMRAISGTAFERALQSAYQRGIPIGGGGAGANLFSYNLLAGYRPNYDAGTALNFGAVDVWSDKDQPGLAFGLRSAVLDSQFFERGRLPRLLNAITLPGSAQVGLGIDSDTGVLITEQELIQQVYGRYAVTVLDARTYRAADSVRYMPPGPMLSLRNVLVHLLAPGSVSYDLRNRQHSLVRPPDRLVRDYGALTTEPHSAPLLLASDLSHELAFGDVLTRFVNWSGGLNANILVIAAGYSTQEQALAAGARFKDALGVPTQTLFVDPQAASPVQIGPEVTGLILVGYDQSLIEPRTLTNIAAAWRSGIPLLMDSAGAAIAGRSYTPYGPTPAEGEAARLASQEAIRVRQMTLRAGMGLVNFNLQPHVQEDNRWARFMALAYNHPAQLALGLPDGAWLEVTPRGSVLVGGSDGVYVLDLRQATLSQGSNQAMAIVNGLLDVFAPGEELQPQTADINNAPYRAPTPVLTPVIAQSRQPARPTVWPTPLPAAGGSAVPTPTAALSIISPAAIEPPEPLPTNPLLLNLMAFTGVLATGASLLGYWINRRRINMR